MLEIFEDITRNYHSSFFVKLLHTKTHKYENTAKSIIEKITRASRKTHTIINK